MVKKIIAVEIIYLKRHLVKVVIKSDASIKLFRYDMKL